MNKPLPLISKICNSFSMHFARKETLSAIISGLINKCNVQHSCFATYLNSEIPQSSIRRVERFFQKQEVSFFETSNILVKTLNFNGKFDLCLDRTNWKFGCKDTNYLVLSWCINQHISLPLLATELNKAGNSNTNERIKLLNQFDELFGFGRIKSLYADREFIGDKWFKSLISNKIKFNIRVKHNGLVPYGDDPIKIDKLFNHLNVGEYRIVEKDMYGSKVYFAGTRSQAGELVIVMSNQGLNARSLLYNYRKRWSIEEMFRKLKTSGFNWENTHMKKPERLLKLLAIMSIAALIVYCVGRTIKSPWRNTVNCRLLSVFKRGIRQIQHVSVICWNKTIILIEEAVNQAGKLMDLKSDG